MLLLLPLMIWKGCTSTVYFPLLLMIELLSPFLLCAIGSEIGKDAHITIMLFTSFNQLKGSRYK
jgi:hypothetical protein